MRVTIYQSDNLELLKKLESNSVDLIYIDPPFNTGKVQNLKRIKTTASEDGNRIGFGGKTYKSELISNHGYLDYYDDYLGFLEPRLIEAHRILSPKGTLYFHIDYREVHYCKILLDSIFGRECFLNEIIWAYDYGAKPKNKWPAKHDNILVYVKDPNNYIFNVNDIDREPYMAPGMVTKEKADKGKLPTDVFWHTIVPTNGKERTGYPNQKPMGILRRIIKASSNKDSTVLDFFAGSGSTGEVCLEFKRNCILVDNNPQAIQIMRDRFYSYSLMSDNIIWFKTDSTDLPQTDEPTAP